MKAEDGATVRLAFALASPVFPLLVLLCCSVLEIISRGTGTAAALQAGPPNQQLDTAFKTAGEGTRIAHVTM